MSERVISRKHCTTTSCSDAIRRALLATIVASSLLAVRTGAQEPPAHFPTCDADSTARAFLARVRYLLATADSAERVRLSLVAMQAEEPVLVMDEPVCLAAARGYAGQARVPSPPAAPFPVAVVRIGRRYLVQPGGLSGAEAAAWEVVVFDEAFRRLAGY
jgi:hypothetical protein